MKALFLFFCSIVIFSSGYSQTFTSSNLPIIVIDTHGSSISDDPKVMADMGIIYNGEGQVNNLSDPFNNFNGKIGIELRGSSSQMFPKKPYGIELRDATGADTSAVLLGMPAEEDWVLNAVYNDRSLMRDALAYKLGRELGRYAPRTRYCELVLNGNYQGIYLLVEKIKRDKNRVDISKLEPAEISGDDLTGGYILKIDKATGSSGFGFNSAIPPLNRSNNQVINFQYEYPKFDEIPVEQMQYIKTYIKNFELVLSSTSYRDSQNGYRKFIDVDSFVDFLIINEVTKNVDGYRLSTFLYKDKDSDGGKLVMGPIWDFNLGFGNADYCEGGPPQGWIYNFNEYCSDDSKLVPFWWSRLLSDASFRNKLSERWQELRQDKFSTETIHAYIDSLADVLNQGAQQRNFQKWPIFNQYIWPNYEWEQQTTYPLAMDWLKDWISERMTWLDSNMPSVVTGIDEFSDTATLVVYPNPFKEEGVLTYEIRKPGKIEIAIYDITGRKVGGISRIHLSTGRYQIALSQFNLQAGAYYCSLTNAQTKLTAKIIKQ